MTVLPLEWRIVKAADGSDIHVAVTDDFLYQIHMRHWGDEVYFVGTSYYKHISSTFHQEAEGKTIEDVQRKVFKVHRRWMENKIPEGVLEESSPDWCYLEYRCPSCKEKRWEAYNEGL